MKIMGAPLLKKIEVKLPTTWTDGKAEMGRVREEEKKKSKKRKFKKREDAGARKGRKVAIHSVFPLWFRRGKK